MSKPKPVQLPYQQTNTYQWQQAPESADVQALRDTPTTNEFLEPALQAQFDRNKEKTRNRLESSYNQNIPQSVRENTILNANNQLAGDYGYAMAQGAYQAKQQELNKKLAIAGLTRPQLVQTSSSGYNSQQSQGNGIWGSVIQGAAMVGSAFL